MKTNTVLVAGLAANTSYNATIQPQNGGNVITISAATGGTVSDGAGVLRLTF